MHMRTFVILLRGVMPRGKNKVLMAPLREALRIGGLEDVRTYIQSGNVVARSALPRAALEQQVHDIIRDSSGAELTVVARTAEAFRSILERNPFARTDTSKVYFTVLASRPAADRLGDFLAIDFSPDDVRIVGDCIYTHYATKLSDSRFSNNVFERKLKVAATSRNFNTMMKLVEMCAA